MKHLTDDRTTIPVPSLWDELSSAQILACFTHYIAQESPSTVPVLFTIAGIRRSWRSILWERVMPAHMVEEKNAQISVLAEELTAWMFDPETKSINYTTIINHFPSIRVKYHRFGLAHRRVIGPASLLVDLSFGEFRAAMEELDEYFTLHRSGEDPSIIAHQMDRFIACLYRPQRQHFHKIVVSENFDGQQREPFNRNLIEKNARIVRHMSPALRTIILLWFTFCVRYIQTEELIIGGRTVSLRALFPKPPEGEIHISTSKHTQGGWASILYSIAQEGLFGNAEQTDKVALFDVLLYLFDQHQRNRDLKRKYATKGK